MIKKFYYFCLFTIVLLFIFNPHYISLGNVLEGWAFDNGIILYKQLADFHLPLGRVLPLLTYKLTNWDLRFTPLIGLGIGIINLTLIYKFGKKYLTNIQNIIAMLFFSATYWYFGTGISYYHEQQVGLLLFIGVYYLFDLVNEKNFSNLKLFILGLALSLSELSGQVASISILATIVIAVIFLFTKKGITKDTFKSFIIFSIGGILPLLIVSYYFLTKNALWDFYYYNFFYYQDYASLTSSFWELPFNVILFFYAPLLTGLLSFLTLGKKEGQNKINIAIAWTISVASIPFILFSVFHFHHFTFATPVLAILLGLSFNSSGFKNKLVKFLYFLVYGLMLTYFVLKIVPWHFDRILIPPDFSIKNDLNVDDSTTDVVNWLTQNTKKKDTILVIGNSIVYIKSGRLPSTRPSHSIPYSWVPFPAVKKEILGSLPNYLLTDTNFTSRLARDYKQPDMENLVKDLTSKCFKRVFEIDTWKIYEKLPKACNI